MKMLLSCLCACCDLCQHQREEPRGVRRLGGAGLVLAGVLTPQLSVLSAVSNVLRTSAIASSLLYGNGDPNCRGYTASEENGGDGGCAGA